MEKIKLSFVSTDTDLESELEAYCNSNNDLFINIKSENEYNNAHIVLNLHTAIKLVKHLKREIATIKEGGING